MHYFCYNELVNQFKMKNKSGMNLKQKLKLGITVFGTSIISTSPVWVKAEALNTLDFVFIDTEHIPMDRNQLTYMCQTYNSMDLSPLVRISCPDSFLACMAKDAGAVGVIAPYIESADQVKELVGATKFRPLKGNRLKRILSGEEIPDKELVKYLEKYNSGSLALVNIESSYAVNHLEEILSVPGLDGVIIGPHDLSVNLSLPEMYEHPDFENVVREIIHKTRNRGLAAGIHFPSHPHLQVKWMKEGINIILHGSDMALFSKKLAEDLMKIKSDFEKDHIKKEGNQFV
jgi:4-hydroxy-2-oxoheptanedioate aldolase